MNASLHPVGKRSIRNFPRAGAGIVHVRLVNGANAITRLQSHSPLRLLAPRRQSGSAAWIYTSTYGGGLVAGDQIDLTADIGPGAACLLTTQASTKIFRSADGETTRQSVRVKIGADAVCAILPDPLTCYEDALYEGRQHIEMADGSSLVLVDCLTSGRFARGERWAFERYSSRIEIFTAVGSASADASSHGADSNKGVRRRRDVTLACGDSCIAPSPGTPGEGWGEGLVRSVEEPSPYPSAGVPGEGTGVPHNHVSPPVRGELENFSSDPESAGVSPAFLRLESGRDGRAPGAAHGVLRLGVDPAKSIGHLLFRDAVLLDRAHGPLAAAQRMGSCNCIAVVVVLGPRVAAASAQLLQWASAQPVRPDQDLLFSASPLPGGIVLRVAGMSTHAVGRWIRERLAFVPELLGGDPWARKW